MNKPLPFQVLTFIAALGLSGAANAAPITLFTTDFDSTIPTAISPGTATLTGVQGYAGFGPSGNQFGGSFLRSETANVVTLQLNSLPAHTAINLSFLFAAIDSLDGTGTFPQGDFFSVVVDGSTVLNESFANATPSQIQSYVPPAGVELARRVDLGFSGPGSYYTDSAYNLGADPIFSNIPHSASTLSIQFFIQGVGIQSLSDESWAMDNLTVTAAPIPVPAAVWLFGSGLLGLIGIARRKARVS
ncbi:MAG: VPLPA-CTERM sorting domain-containing protein [Sulfuricaulis sp.]|nr:VPLPA-CTERM sorting domain-containing protein [Sulfuricaulis sp.]